MNANIPDQLVVQSIMRSCFLNRGELPGPVNTHKDASDQHRHIERPFPSDDVDGQTPEERSCGQTCGHGAKDDPLSIGWDTEFLIERRG